MESHPLLQYILDFDPDDLDNINSYVPIPGEWPRNWSCFAGDMGGTHFRVGRVDFDANGAASIAGYQDFPMPGAKKEVPVEDLFDFYEELKSTYGVKDSALCFSYPAEIYPDGTAKIIRLAKGLKLSGAVGYKINESVVNDTVAVLLGSKGANMGMVLGTGFNIAYIKDGKIIDAECGLYEGFVTEDFDYGPKAEMQISGKYLNPLIEKMNDSIPKEELIDRAAKVVAGEVLRLSNYAGYKDIKLAVEGTTFYKLEGLRESIEKYCLKLLDNITFIDGRNTTMIGAAIALYERRYRK